MRTRAKAHLTFRYFSIDELQLQLSFHGKNDRSLRDFSNWNIRLKPIVRHNMTVTWPGMMQSVRSELVRDILVQTKSLVRQKLLGGSSAGAPKQKGEEGRLSKMKKQLRAATAARAFAELMGQGSSSSKAADGEIEEIMGHPASPRADGLRGSPVRDLDEQKGQLLLGTKASKALSGPRARRRTSAMSGSLEKAAALKDARKASLSAMSNGSSKSNASNSSGGASSPRKMRRRNSQVLVPAGVIVQPRPRRNSQVSGGNRVNVTPPLSASPEIGRKGGEAPPRKESVVSLSSTKRFGRSKKRG